MAADTPTFSVEAIRVNGEPLVALEGLKATDPVRAIADKLCDAFGIPQSHGAARLKLMVGTCQVSLTSSGLLGDAGIGPGTELTVLLQAEPQVFEYNMEYQKDGMGATEQSRLLLLTDSCFLVRREYDPCDATGDPERPMQWDVLCGSYEIADGNATCSWNVHLQRRIVYNGEDPEDTKDSGWHIMDERASFKWTRLRVAEKVDCGRLEEKITSMSLEQLEEALLEDARSNDLEEVAGELAEMFQAFTDDANTRSLLNLEGGDDSTLIKAFLSSELMKLYKGQSLRMGELWSPGLQIHSALFPGKVLGLSPCWIRLEESEEKKVCAESDVYMPGVDCGRSCLLGIQVNDLWKKPLDLADLPQLLGL